MTEHNTAPTIEPLGCGLRCKDPDILKLLTLAQQQPSDDDGEGTFKAPKWTRQPHKQKKTVIPLRMDNPFATLEVQLCRMIAMMTLFRIQGVMLQQVRSLMIMTSGGEYYSICCTVILMAPTDFKLVAQLSPIENFSAQGIHLQDTEAPHSTLQEAPSSPEFGKNPAPTKISRTATVEDVPDEDDPQSGVVHIFHYTDNSH